MAILGIDFGKKRIGVALSEYGEQSEALKVINYQNLSSAVDEIKKLCDEHEIQEIVVGVPERDVIGARKFGEELEEELALPVKFEIEDLTSQQAAQFRKSNESADDVAAALILQSYLDSR